MESALTDLYEDIDRSNVWTDNLMMFRLGHQRDTVGSARTASSRSL